MDKGITTNHLSGQTKLAIQFYHSQIIIFFSGSKESVRKQIGMAVPLLGVNINFEAVLKRFAGREFYDLQNIF